MNRITQSLMAAVTTVTLMAVPVGATPEETYLILGAGNVTCGEYVTEPSDLRDSVHEWILGYISGLNSFGTTSEARTAGKGMIRGRNLEQWLWHWCQSRSFVRIANAADQLRAQFMLIEQTQ